MECKYALMWRDAGRHEAAATQRGCHRHICLCCPAKPHGEGRAGRMDGDTASAAYNSGFSSMLLGPLHLPALQAAAALVFERQQVHHSVFRHMLEGIMLFDTNEHCISVLLLMNAVQPSHSMCCHCRGCARASSRVQRQRSLCSALHHLALLRICCPSWTCSRPQDLRLT